MSMTMNLMKNSEIRRIGTEALIKALGPIGMARYLEEYDDGGRGDYTDDSDIDIALITKCNCMEAKA